MEYTKENIKLICADNLKIMKQYPDNYFDWAVLDPPYGIEWSKRTDKSFVNRHKTTKAFNSNIDWDKKPSPEYWIEIKRVSKFQMIWGINYFSEHFDYFIPVYWDKMNGASQYSDGELCGIVDPNIKKSRILKHAHIGRYNPEPKKIHETQKPTFVYRQLFDWYIKKPVKILDTNSGSASSAIASFGNQNIIEYIGIEISKNHFNNSIKRFKEQTMQKRLF